MAEEKVVNLNDRVEVVATEKHPHAKKGEVLKIHPNLVDKQVKAGFITKK